jgi:TldD protein
LKIKKIRRFLVDFLSLAMDTAKSLGADYADIRIQKSHTEMILLRNLSLKNTSLQEVYGYGIRVFKNGAWGFAHNNVFSKEAVNETVKKAFAIAQQSGRIRYGDGLKLAHERGYIDSYKTPLSIDPFDRSSWQYSCWKVAKMKNCLLQLLAPE